MIKNIHGPSLRVVLTATILVTTWQNAQAQEAETDPTPMPAVSTSDSPRQGDSSGLAVASDSHTSYVVPAIGIVTFDFLLNRYGEHFIDHDIYNVSLSSVRHNVSSAWVVDNDPFSTNQFLHPYQGAMYHGFARSAGLTYWQSLGYAFAGSAMWEIVGETTLPSVNDQIASGIGGAFLGEPLFRMANLVLERSDHLPRFWREFFALAISPSTEFNRVAYGDRFSGVYSSRNAQIFSRADFGLMGTATVRKGLLQSLTRNEAVADFSLDYGLPGNWNDSYTRPFDYFSLEFAASSANKFEHIFTRGLLAGWKHGENGVWGLYGTYDYVAPQIFRVSSVAASLGDTSDRRLLTSVELQTTVLGGVGYGAAGTINGADEQDYHYGVTPQMLVAARFISLDRAALDLTLRDFFVSRLASTAHRGSENNARVDGLLTFRIRDHHGATLKYIWSRRTAAYPDLGQRIQSRGTFGLFYTYLGDEHFGAAAR